MSRRKGIVIYAYKQKYSKLRTPPPTKKNKGKKGKELDPHKFVSQARGPPIGWRWSDRAHRKGRPRNEVGGSLSIASDHYRTVAQGSLRALLFLRKKKREKMLPKRLKVHPSHRGGWKGAGGRRGEDYWKLSWGLSVPLLGHWSFELLRKKD